MAVCKVRESIIMSMSILQFLKPVNDIPDLNGQLSSVVPSAAIRGMNQEVLVASESSSSTKQGPY